MNPSDVYATVSQILTTELGVPAGAITLTADLRDDLDMDSLDRVEFVMALEGTFGGCLDAESADRVDTVQDVVDAVVRAGATVLADTGDTDETWAAAA